MRQWKQRTTWSFALLIMTLITTPAWAQHYHGGGHPGGGHPGGGHPGGGHPGGGHHPGYPHHNPGYPHHNPGYPHHNPGYPHYNYGHRPGGYWNGGVYYTNSYYTTPSQTTYVAAPAVTRYQVPAEYVGTAPGYVINYGGANYITNTDGTMSPYSGPVAGQ